jgi:hypothetical protein
MRLHREYGIGLQNLREPLTNPHSLKQAQTDPATNGQNTDGSFVFNSYTIYPHQWQSFPLGVVSGLQYNNQTWGKCFYAMADTIKFVGYLEKDYEALFTEGDFYQLMVYDPIRLLSNYLALYE